jgi:RNA polymerase sigma-70 factor, ECF subfamily
MKLSLGPTNGVSRINEPSAVDPRLVRNARTGDAIAYRAIYEVCAPSVHALLLAHAPLDAVDDLMQETFCSAWQDLPKLSDESRFQAWLMAIARNKVRRHFRQAKRDRLQPLDESLHLPMTAATELNCSEPRQQIVAAIRSFPPRERELLMLRLLEEWPTKQIADALELQPQSVKVQLSRALAKLRGMLNPEGVQ